MKVKPATYLILWWMRLTGFRGITLPWAIYLRPDSINDAALIRHERTHEAQIKTHGVLGFYSKYLWYSLRFGYLNNPFEIEARAAEINTPV